MLSHQWCDPDRVKAAIATAFWKNDMKFYAADILNNERHVHLHHHWPYQVFEGNDPIVMFLVEGSPAKGWGHITFNGNVEDGALEVELFTVNGRSKHTTIPFGDKNKSKVYTQYADAYAKSKKFKHLEN